MRFKNSPLLERSDGREKASDQRFSRGSQERGCRQVELPDSPHGIERAVPDRREVVQVRIPRRCLLESLLGFSQLAILHLELHLMDMKIVDESLAILVARLERELALRCRGEDAFQPLVQPWVC